MKPDTGKRHVEVPRAKQAISPAGDPMLAATVSLAVLLAIFALVMMLG